MDLGEVIERSGSFRIEDAVVSAIVLELEPTLFDIDVGCTVFAHSAKLDQMCMRADVTHSKDQIEGAEHVVVQRLNGTSAALHRKRGRRLLGEMDEHVWAEVLQQLDQSLVILRKIAATERDRMNLVLQAVRRVPPLNAL